LLQPAGSPWPCLARLRDADDLAPAPLVRDCPTGRPHHGQQAVQHLRTACAEALEQLRVECVVTRRLADFKAPQRLLHLCWSDGNVQTIQGRRVRWRPRRHIGGGRRLLCPRRAQDLKLLRTQQLDIRAGKVGDAKRSRLSRPRQFRTCRLLSPLCSPRS
jgi:hypothetical protein